MANVEDDQLYMELWKACAGPLVEVPRCDERVFYFPQGHMEQLVASTNQRVVDKDIPIFNLPPKILCRVLNVMLKAEHETDEVYAQITLQPEEDQQSEPTSLDSPKTESAKQTVDSFVKILTASDTSTHGGFSVLRKHATECLPSLDMTQTTPTQELVARDLHGYEWRGKTGDLRVGVRRLAKQQSTMPASVISSQSMHLGVLATASHAFNTTSMFVVLYKPRISQFIIGVNKYMDALKKGFGIGMRFRMRFEGEESPERIFTGTVVGSGDLSPQWPASKWRSLQVQWDEPSTVQRPNKVSPWEIEPFLPSTLTSSPTPPHSKSKRSRPIDSSASEITGSPVASNFLSSYPKSHHEPSPSLKLLFQDPSSERNSNKTEVPATSSCRLFGFDLKSKPPNPNDKQVISVDSNNSGSTKCQDPNSLNSQSNKHRQQEAEPSELEKMFEIEGELRTKDKWAIVFTDDEGDMMLVGDDPWNEFCKMAKKLLIYSSDEVKKNELKVIVG
ncbi:unnamed protein product [Eruca vesicaria subsp. sativa]|uniref:Auxin-responsive protein n=1 Tax=Eruca vesicaria subsp. sativa TaxID=29727 RepID=A0ABC8LT65_ERUVS|nr:unnamed protein product [Eruca vesicaria subsp. sativa]